MTDQNWYRSGFESEKRTLSALCALFDNRSAAGTPSLAALLSISTFISFANCLASYPYARGFDFKSF